MTTVSEVLEERLAAREPSRWVGAFLALAAHAAFIALLVLISKPRPVTFVPVAVPVRIVSPQALGSPAPPQPAPAEKPREKTEEKPAPPKAKPVIEKPLEKPVPSKEAMPLPKPSKEKPKPAPPAPAPPKGGAPAVELPSAAGAPTGEATGTSNFGASVAAFDADFPFAYYIEQLQSLIGANWLKPNVADATSCVISFHIQRSGQVTDVKVETTSGLPFYDRAAARAVYAANPLPPLPPEFTGDRLGVHLKFQ